jgi:hypothetical protein
MTMTVFVDKCQSERLSLMIHYGVVILINPDT